MTASGHGNRMWLPLVGATTLLAIVVIVVTSRYSDGVGAADGEHGQHGAMPSKQVASRGTSAPPTWHQRKRPSTANKQHLFTADHRLLAHRKLRISPVNVAEVAEVARRLPDVIIFGAKKCGTKSLIMFLGSHSRIAAAEREAHFFDHRFELGMEFYRSLMPESNARQLTVEKTPGYLLSEHAPERIRASLPDTVKLVVILRDPVARAVSDYTHYVAKHPAIGQRGNGSHGEAPSIESLIMHPGTDRINDHSKIIRTGMYAQRLRPWLEMFGRDRIHVVDGELFIRQPWKELRLVQRFLNIPLELTKGSFKFNERKGFYCVTSKGQSARDGAKHVGCLPSNKGRTHKRVEPATLARLSEHYAADTNKFVGLFNRKLSWMH